jgi:hypothetical protein
MDPEGWQYSMVFIVGYQSSTLEYKSLEDRHCFCLGHTVHTVQSW